jgi:hypothetical protein
MKKNLMPAFVEWYINTREGKDTHYLVNNFRSDREVFIANLTEYAEEYVLAFRTKLFIFNEKEKTMENFIRTLRNNLYNKKSTFAAFSASRCNHMPQALLGNNNYIAFLRELQKSMRKGKKLPEVALKMRIPDIEEYLMDSSDDSLPVPAHQPAKHFLFRFNSRNGFFDACNN